MLQLLILNRTVCPQYSLENKDRVLPSAPSTAVEPLKEVRVPMMKGH